MCRALAGRPFVVLAVFLSLFLYSVIHAQDTYDSSESKFHLSGEGGAAFFDTGSGGAFPNDEFRLDEARLFVEAAIWEDIYVFGELNLHTREQFDEDLEVGEVYVQFENLSKVFGKDEILNVRIGRFDIPFGEEYLSRDAIDNPLISHSLSDLWGIDEGAEAYGTTRYFQYVFAVQNGGEPTLHDFTSDKSITGRILVRPVSAFHFSVSGMRTGRIDTLRDQFAALWFGNRLLSPPAASSQTTEFRANVFEGDGHFEWNGGHLHAAGGRLKYSDNAISDYTARNIRFYYVEAVQNLRVVRQQRLYGGIRFSRMTAPDGFPIVANGNPNLFYYSGLTDRIWSLSAGIGYQIGRHVLLKAEYNFERGDLTDGSHRNDENLFGLEAAFKF